MKHFIRFLSGLIDLGLIACFLLLLLFGGYAIWDDQQIYSGAGSSLYESYKPEAEEAGVSFSELTALNPDVLGWMTVYGTGIDYPLVQGETDDDYINTDIYGQFTLSGSIFLASSNARDFSDFNTIIYGHHMDQSKMFGDVDKFEDEAFFESHEYGDLFYGGQHHGLRFFAYVEGDAYDFRLYENKLEGTEAKLSYLQYIRGLAKHLRDVEIGENDHIVMLSTCADAMTNGRYILFGLITDEVYENPYPETEAPVISRMLSGTALTKRERYLICGGSLVLVLACIGILYRLVRKRRSKGER